LEHSIMTMDTGVGAAPVDDSDAARLVTGVEQLLTLAAARRDAEGVPLAQRLLGQAGDAKSLPATLPLAKALNQLGMFFYGREYAGEAASAYMAALDVVHRCAPDDRASIAALRNNLGQAQERLGDLVAARENLEQALAIRQALPDTPLNIAITQDNLASVLTGLGETERAAGLIRQALETFESVRGPAHDDVATALNNLARLYAREGDVARTRATYLYAVDTHLQNGGLDASGTLVAATNLASFSLDHRDTAMADELADLLLAIGGSQPDARHHAAGVALLTLAGRAFHAFSLGPAERLATRARDLLQATEGQSASKTLEAAALLANVYSAKGNTAAAESLQMQLLEVPGQTPLDRAQRLVDFGKSLRERGRGSFAGAIAMFEHALAILRQHPDPGGEASALGNLAQVRFENDEPDAAATLYEQALDAIGRDESRQDTPWLLHGLAMVRYHMGRHDEALAGYQHAHGLWTRRLGPRHPFVATTEANLALVHWAHGDLNAAAGAFAAAHRLREPEMARLLAVGSERERLEAAREQLDNLYKVLSFQAATGEASTLAATMLLQHKAGVLDALAQSYERLRRSVDPEARVLLDRLAGLQREIGNAVASETLLGAARETRSVAALQAESDRVQVELSHRGAFGQTPAGLPTLDGVRAALPPDAVLLEYARYPVFNPIRTGAHDSWQGARYAALVLHAKGAPEWVDLGDAGVIEAAVVRLRAHLAEPELPGIEDALRDLSECAVAPVMASLARARLLLVAPDGALNLVPFGVLGTPPLAERFTIGLVAGGREIVRCMERKVALTPPHAIVNPDYGEPGGTLLLEPLPGTREEALALRALWPDLRVVEDQEATADTLRGLSRPAMLHVGTHGHFDEPEAGATEWDAGTLLVDDRLYLVQRAGRSPRADAMLHGGLAFAGANRSRPGQPVGIVSAAELAQLDLQGTALVVLSACETGLGTAVQGEEFAGLRRAFAIAGSHAQLTSLWWVDDEAAAAFMRAFYTRLRHGAGRAEAVRDAQREVRARPEWSHPAYWASFVMWGDPGPLPESLIGGRRSNRLQPDPGQP
jgi:CHAT domain-containing protein/tetratricopeptide (TPR) repeat protein